jgi:hypothetical protein
MKELLISSKTSTAFMGNIRNEKYIMITIVIGFIGAFIIQILWIGIYPPDFTGAFPIYDADGAILAQLAGAFLLIGMTVIAMKAEEERQILAAAGFTAQAISFGVSMLSIFEITGAVTLEGYENFYRLMVSSNFLYFPSLLLIATYNRLKKWIRITGFVASFPLIISNIMFMSGIRDYKLLENVSNIGYMMIGITWALWGLNIYSNYRTAHRVS